LKSVDFRNDPMFLRNQFARDGTFEMPIIKKTKLDLDNIELIGYDKLSEGQKEKIVHFFLDDYKFEVLWKEPEPRVEKLKEYRAILSPQFSMYTEMPVAVSTVGMRSEKQLFMAGYKEMLRRIKPKAVICYGEPFEEMEGKLIVIDYAKTNNLMQEKSLTKPIIKYVHAFIDKGGGAAGGGNGGQRCFPKFPGWDPTKCPGEGYEWRGSGEPGSGKGSWYNPITGEMLYPDLNHPDPLPPHWDYFNGDGSNGYRIFEYDSYAPKAFEQEGVVLK